MMKNKYKIILLLSMVYGFSNVDAQQIKLIDKDVKINDDGSANITLQLNLGIESTSSLIKIPALQGNPIEINSQLDNNQADLVINQNNEENYSYLAIDSQLPIGEHSILIEYILSEFIDWADAGPGEFKAYEFGIKLDNPFPTQIDTFNLMVSLPKGWNYHKIVESNPIFEDKDPQPPYKLYKTDDGRANVTISRIDMKFKDSIGMTFLFKSTSKSIFIIIGAVILAALYMIVFRDLISKINEK